MPKKAPRAVKKKSTTKQRPVSELRGSCGCGSVTFTVKGKVSQVVWCHCSKCQRFHGGPGPSASAPRGAISFQRRDGLAWWDASPTVQRGFCRQCGSSLFFSDSNQATLAICAGAFTSPTGLVSAGHLFVASKPDWYELNDGLPHLETT